MIDGRKLMELLKDDYAWRELIERLHDDAGLDAYDHTLIVAAAEELAEALRSEIHDTLVSGMRRHLIIEEWRKKNATAATVA